MKTEFIPRKLTTEEQLEMMNLILHHTLPIAKTRAKLQQRYGRKAFVEDGIEPDVVLPPQIACVDNDLMRLEEHVKDVILKEYGQLAEEYDPEMEIVI